jgi:LytS/YehU family sensor histidine kinase
MPVVRELLALSASCIAGLTIRRPIATLVGFMERAEQESFRLRIDHARLDELDYLFDSFNDMVARMMQSLESYLYLQTYRCSSLVTYSVEADDDTRDCLVLNLVVQPVVENAVIHGMGRRTVPGNMSVRASREGGVVRFRVVDTGAGIGADKLATIRAGMESSSGDEASGLRNVHRRLQLVYGPEYGIRIWSEEGHGTTVEIVMPAAFPRASA